MITLTSVDIDSVHGGEDPGFGKVIDIFGRIDIILKISDAMTAEFNKMFPQGGPEVWTNVESVYSRNGSDAMDEAYRREGGSGPGGFSIYDPSQEGGGLRRLPIWGDHVL